MSAKTKTQEVILTVLNLSGIKQDTLETAVIT